MTSFSLPLIPLRPRIVGRVSFALCLVLGALEHRAASPFAIHGPGVQTNDLRITTFASGLYFPLGMARLSDGSLLVAVSEGPIFWTAPGKLLRLVDADGDGVADGPGTVLFSGLPGVQTSLRLGGNLVFVTGQGKPISILRKGATPSSSLTFVGQIYINYPSGGWEHPHSALRTRATPGQSNSYDVIFQIGSKANFAATTNSASLSSAQIPGANGTLLGDSIYMLTIIDENNIVRATNLTQLANGLRNPAGFAFHPVTGDFYFADNGIDGLVDPNEPISADELNIIPPGQFGTAVEFFGFPTNYIQYRTGLSIGGAGIQPLIAFAPLPDPFTGAESEGPNDIEFAPPAFPDALSGGIFVTFHGKFNIGGTNNEENALVYVDLKKTNYFHFIESREPNIGHLDGLLATEDSLFVADLCSTGNLNIGTNSGVIYQIKSLVLPPLHVRRLDNKAELTWNYGILQGAETAQGQWFDIPDAASPTSVDADQPQKFFRLRK